MLPLSEFQFAFCSIATFAATLGYACARKHSRPIIPDSDMEAGMALCAEKAASSAASLQESPSLKRKLVEDADQESVSDRPQKRSKTPPGEEHLNLDCTPVIATEEPPEALVPVHVAQVDEEPIADAIEQTEPLAVISQEHLPSPKDVAPATTAPVEEPSSPKPYSSAFAAFATANSHYAVSASTASSSLQTPIWRRSTSPAKSNDIDSDSSSETLVGASPRPKSNAIEESRQNSSIITTLNKPEGFQVTGEEDETVEAELKGVRLFTKRGAKDFTDMYGHIKILSNAQSLKDRLLFRRDPLGQVSMNVSLLPTVRCAYDAEDNVLRIILKEQAGLEGRQAESVVIYALKPGRAPKADFRAFAESLLANEHLKSVSAAARAASTTES
ncbi:hypothetical protein BV22DRAFT_1031968 [Leucogyrophana mollusca]|uniref:Uncharacterized protein n=1 Tax=Leucogyrophana mollusca TaxID=85980 RepID=A0ACB8BP54_9AGAM|nr:hypothetical protein BV22DRAFT_1031968 [Leucogyrophana mollusca]